MLAEMERGQKKLASVQELAQGKTYAESMKTSWRPPAYIRNLSPAEQQAVRDKYSILVEGEDPPPAIEHFADMKIPKPILKYLQDKGIKRPTPIQIQGIPAV
jgi:ATP-dependent RNA helicase DDX41